jgi:hypothetical protein
VKGEKRGKQLRGYGREWKLVGTAGDSWTAFSAIAALAALLMNIFTLDEQMRQPIFLPAYLSPQDATLRTHHHRI